MFILLKPIDRDDNLKNRLHDTFFVPRFDIERVEMKNAAPFFVMSCPKYKGRVPYNTVAVAAGKMKNKIVVPEDLMLPENVAITPFSGRKLKRQLLINTALKILSSAQSECLNTKLTFIDEFAAYTEKIDKFAECVRELTVLTNYPERYEMTAQKLVQCYGVSLKVKKGTFFDGQQGIVISDKSENVTPFFKGLIFTNSEKFPVCSHAVIGNGVNLKKYTDYDFPIEFDSVDIGEAMYELCYAGKLGNLCYETVSFDETERTYEEISKLCLNSLIQYCK